MKIFLPLRLFSRSSHEKLFNILQLEYVSKLLQEFSSTLMHDIWHRDALLLADTISHSLLKHC